MPESTSPNRACSYACKWPFALPNFGFTVELCMSAFHGLQENIFQRVAPEVHPPDTYLTFRGETENVASLHPIGQNHLHAVCGYSAFTTELLDRFGKIAICPIGLQFETSFV